jgi:putative hydrolase of HD superfamily
VRARLSVRLREPDLHARLLGRTVMGKLVIDHEIVTRNFPEGIGTIQLAAMYEVRGDRISRSWFKFGEKQMGASA